MPPVPPSVDPEILDLIAAIDRRKKDLFEFQLPRLRNYKGSIPTQQQYAAEIRDDTDLLTRQIEELEITVEDQNGERTRQSLRQSVQQLLQELSKLKKDTRAALLISKQNIDAQNASNREELFRSPGKQESNEKVTEDALMRANNDVTEALRRTIGLMQGELERSVLSTQMLDTSTSTLRSTSTTYDTLDNVLMMSKQLITALEKADRMDRALIIAGLVFFFLVVLFILKQRVIDRGLRIALFWTRFIPRGSKDLVNKMERGDLTATVTSLASTVTTVITAARGDLTSSVTSLASSLSSTTTTAHEAIETENVGETITNIIMEDEQSVETKPVDIHDEL